MGLPATIATVLAVPVTLGWLLAEWRWSRYRLSVRSPVSLGRDDP